MRTHEAGAAESTATDSFPLQVRGMDVVARRMSRAFTTPIVSWEPVINLTPPEDLQAGSAGAAQLLSRRRRPDADLQQQRAAGSDRADSGVRLAGRCLRQGARQSHRGVVHAALRDEALAYLYKTNAGQKKKP